MGTEQNLKTSGEMRLFLKSNRVMETNDRIIEILAHLRGGIASIYV